MQTVMGKHTENMITNILRTSALGLAFCIGQGFVEAILGYFITTVRQASDVNLEGAFLYFFIRLIITVAPYVAIFCFILLKTSKVLPSIIAFGLNLIILSTFLYVGLIQKDPLSFAIASILTSLSFILIDRKVNFIGLARQIKNASA